jgi:WD40 repeat protein
LVLTGSLDSTAKIWSCAPEECLKTLHGRTRGISSAVFSPDGALVLRAPWTAPRRSGVATRGSA